MTIKRVQSRGKKGREKKTALILPFALHELGYGDVVPSLRSILLRPSGLRPRFECLHAGVECTALLDQTVELLGFWKVGLSSRDVDPFDVRDSASSRFRLEYVLKER